MRNEKFGAQKNVGSRSRTAATPSPETVHEATKSRSVIGSSSSGSSTVPSARQTSSRRVTAAPRRRPARPGTRVLTWPARSRLRSLHLLLQLLARLHGLVRRRGDPALRRDVDVVELGRVDPEDLLL